MGCIVKPTGTEARFGIESPALTGVLTESVLTAHLGKDR